MAKNCAKRALPQNDAALKPQAYYRIHTLLHTVRSISLHEDDLCCLLTEIESSGTVTAEVSNELRTLLEQMSGDEYQNDLNAVWRSLSIVPPQRAANVKSGPPAAHKKMTSMKKKKVTTRNKRNTTPATRRITRPRAA